MLYENLQPNELSCSCIEVTVWNYDKQLANPAMGGVVLDLSGELLQTSMNPEKCNLIT